MCDDEGAGWGPCLCPDAGTDADVDGFTDPDPGPEADTDVSSDTDPEPDPDGDDGADTEPGVVILVDDPLEGSTVGTQDGNGEFSEGGWYSSGGCIKYDLGEEIDAGYARIRMKGFEVPIIPPGWEVGDDKVGIHLFNGGNSSWEHKFKWRFGPTYHFFKVIYLGPGMEDKKGMRIDDPAVGERINTIDENEYEVEWMDNEIIFKVDGSEVFSYTFSDVGIFTLKEIRIGTDCVGTWFEDAIITNVEVGKYINR